MLVSVIIEYINRKDTWFLVTCCFKVFTVYCLLFAPAEICS